MSASPGEVGRTALAVLALTAGLALAPAGPAQATFPGRDGRIAFGDFMTGQLYTVNPDGSALMQVTHVSAGHRAGRPDWSPDGRQLAYDSDQSGEIRMYVMDADGSHARLLFRDAPGYRHFGPKFTPGGKTFVFSRCKPDDGVCAIYSVRADGTGLRALTAFKEGRQEAVDFAPAVSPDGAWITFDRFFSNGITAQVYLMRADGSRAHAITPPRLQALRSNWSPDGRHIAFFSNCCRLGSEVFTVRPDGSAITRLTNSPFPSNNVLPAYSPRGDRIAFSSDRKYSDLCCEDLFVMEADGSGEHLVRTGLTGVVDVAWGTARLQAP